jgi:hypothetical protein
MEFLAMASGFGTTGTVAPSFLGGTASGFSATPATTSVGSFGGMLMTSNGIHINCKFHLISYCLLFFYEIFIIIIE